MCPPCFVHISTAVGTCTAKFVPCLLGVHKPSDVPLKTKVVFILLLDFLTNRQIHVNCKLNLHVSITSNCCRYVNHDKNISYDCNTCLLNFITIPDVIHLIKINFTAHTTYTYHYSWSFVYQDNSPSRNSYCRLEERKKTHICSIPLTVYGKSKKVGRYSVVSIVQ